MGYIFSMFSCHEWNTLLWGALILQSFAFAAVVLRGREAKPPIQEEKPSNIIQLNSQLIRELENTERNLRNVFDSALEGIVVHDRGIIIDANRAFLQLVGLSFHDLMGTVVTDYVGSEEKERLEESLFSNMVNSVDVTSFGSKGSQNVEMTTRPYHFRGHPVRLTTVRAVRADRMLTSLSNENVDRQLAEIKYHIDLAHELLDSPDQLEAQLVRLQGLVSVMDRTRISSTSIKNAS